MAVKTEGKDFLLKSTKEPRKSVTLPPAGNALKLLVPCTLVQIRAQLKKKKINRKTLCYWKLQQQFNNQPNQTVQLKCGHLFIFVCHGGGNKLNQSPLPRGLKKKKHVKTDVCGFECNSGFLLNHHLPPSLIHEAAAADYLLIDCRLLTVTVTHPRCSACYTVFNGRLAEHNSARGCSDPFQSMSRAPADATGSLRTRSPQRRRRVASVRHGCPLLVQSPLVQLRANNLQYAAVQAWWYIMGHGGLASQSAVISIANMASAR